MSINLGVSALEAKIEQYLKTIVPIGTVVAFAGATVPEGWLLCGGSPVSIATYPELSAAIGTVHGNGTQNADGSASGFTGTHFNLPDYRGRLLRGVDGVAGNDPDKLSRTASKTGGNTGNAVGSVQADAMQGHWHNVVYHFGTNTAGIHGLTDTNGTGLGSSGQVSSREAATDGVNGTPRTTSETRPKNANVNYIIRAI